MRRPRRLSRLDVRQLSGRPPQALAWRITDSVCSRALGRALLQFNSERGDSRDRAQCPPRPPPRCVVRSRRLFSLWALTVRRRGRTFSANRRALRVPALGRCARARTTRQARRVHGRRAMGVTGNPAASAEERWTLPVHLDHDGGEHQDHADSESAQGQQRERKTGARLRAVRKPELVYCLLGFR